MLDFLKGTVTPQDWMVVAGVVGLAAVLAAGFYFFVHQSQLDTLQEIKTQDQQVSSDLQRAQTMNQEIGDLRTETEEIQILVEDFEERLPSGREIRTLINEFERMASEEDISVELRPLPRQKDAEKETIPYAVVARGGYHRIAAFINRLERFKRYLKITELDMGPAVKGIATANFTLNTYRFLATNTGESS